MILLVAGLLLWSGAHLFKRVAPGARAKLGDPGKGLVALLLVVSVVLMVLGYRRAETGALWLPPEWTVHLNNLLMVVAFYLFAVSGPKGAKVWVGTKLRHPQLTAVILWAVAHLLANGEVKAVVLFGGMLAWAVASIAIINRQDGPWTPPPQAAAAKEVSTVVITAVVLTVVIGIHGWVGPWPVG